jgi:hypothetical protein
VRRWQSFRVLSRALQREGGQKKVADEAYFTADVIRPDMLWDKILRSPWRTRASSVNCQSRAKSSGRQGD